MLSIRFLISALLAMMWALPAVINAQVTCEYPALQTPRRGSPIADLQPELIWAGDPQASYRVQVAVILPEGRILESVDTVVTGNRWKFVAPISVLHAAVKVIVSRNCPALSVQDLHADRPYFFINAFERCALKPSSLRQAKNALQWDGATPADKFIVQVFELTRDVEHFVQTRRVMLLETVTPNWTISDDILGQLRKATGSESTLVASVQAQCGVLLSPPQSLALGGIN